MSKDKVLTGVSSLMQDVVHRRTEAFLSNVGAALGAFRFLKLAA